MSRFLLHSWGTFSLGISLWVGCSFLSSLESTVLLSSSFHSLMRNFLPLICFSSYRKGVICSLAAFNTFSLSSVFKSILIMCLVMQFFEFLLFRIFSDSWFCRFISLAQQGKFLAIISSSTFLICPFCLLLTLCWHNLRFFL